MNDINELCPVCGQPSRDCSCCPECGHICSLDYGEPFCPVCLPERHDSGCHEYFMRLAMNEAEKAYNAGEVPVGAVMVKASTVLSSAGNTRGTNQDPTAHAEINALREAAARLGTWRLHDCTLYVTKEPCVMCAGALVNARLGKLVFGCRDERFGAVQSRFQLACDPILNHEVVVVSGIREKECADILKKFFDRRR